MQAFINKWFWALLFCQKGKKFITVGIVRGFPMFPDFFCIGLRVLFHILEVFLSGRDCGDRSIEGLVF